MSSAKDVMKELKEIVLNPFDDEFYQNSMMLNFGDLGVSLKQLVEKLKHSEGHKFQRKTQGKSDMATVEDMQRAAEAIPEFLNFSTHVSKHMAIVPEMSRLVQTRKLMDISGVEQDIVSTHNPKDHYKQVLDILGDPQAIFEDKLRLVLIYALRYEEHSSSLPRLRSILRDLARNQNEHDRVRLVDTVLRFCGEGHRGGQLFEKKSVGKALKSFLGGQQGAESNQFTQHKTLLESQLDQLLAGRLSPNDYPAVGGRVPQQPPDDVMVFMFGGTTYEEAAFVRERNTNTPVQIILGGSYVHNSRTFLDDIARNFPQIGIAIHNPM